MNSLQRLLIVAGIALSVASPSLVISAGNDGEQNGGKSAPRVVEMTGTHLLTVHSAIVGRDYDLYVGFPRHYADTTRRFPVVYILDGQWDFQLVNAINGGQYYDGFIPEVILVGITWGGENPNYDSLRALDLTPTQIKQMPSSGNAAKFLAAIKGELIPYIDSKYRTDKTDRTLVGSSLGGLFTLYTMFKETDLFQRYLLTSPSIPWDNGVLYTYEQSYHAQHQRLPVTLFMGYSSLEGIETIFNRFVDTLKSRNYRDLRFETRVIEGMGHSGSKPEGYTRGMQFVLEPPPVHFEPSNLKAFVGKYRLNPQIAVDVLIDNDHIVLVTPDSQKILLYGYAENEFRVRGMYLRVKFLRNAAGSVTGAHVEQFQGGFDLTREG